MRAFEVSGINRKAAKNAAPKKKQSEPDLANHSPDYFSAGSSDRAVLYRKADCACGGGCPNCQAKSSGLKVSQPNDAAEIEADHIADKIMRMPEGRVSPAAGFTQTKPAIHRKCKVCANDEETIQRKPLPSDGERVPSRSPSHVHEAISSGGRPLDLETRGFFEPRLGFDLGGVRIHTGAAAARSARSLNAQAYTLGSNIVFGAGYRPGSETDRYLLAHELVHVGQQAGENVLHRKLKVVSEEEAIAPDPVSSTANAASRPKVDLDTAVLMIGQFVKALCPDYDVANDGEITSKAGRKCVEPALASKQSVGCCCLCTLVSALREWEIVVTSKDAPTTDPSTHTVYMTPSAGLNAPEFRYWSGGAVEAIFPMSQVETFSHELCGHAALMQIKAHPSNKFTTTRPYSDVHDPSVKVGNAVSEEMGQPGDRGLAGSGKHRGESLRVFKIGPYDKDADSAKAAAFADQIKAVVNFLDNDPDLMVDLIGYRGVNDTDDSVGGRRAIDVGAELESAIKEKKVTVKTGAAQEEDLTRVQPVIDGGLWEPIVRLHIAAGPAGLMDLAGTKPPTDLVSIPPEHSNRVKRLMKGGKWVNDCHELLATTAWK